MQKFVPTFKDGVPKCALGFSITKSKGKYFKKQVKGNHVVLKMIYDLYQLYIAKNMQREDFSKNIRATSGSFDILYGHIRNTPSIVEC